MIAADINDPDSIVTGTHWGDIPYRDYVVHLLERIYEQKYGTRPFTIIETPHYDGWSVTIELRQMDG